MLDGALRRFSVPVTARASQWLYRKPLAPWGLLAASFAAGLGSSLAISRSLYLPGLALLAASKLSSAFAGPVEDAVSPRALLGFVADILVTASIPFAFALADPSRALAGCFLILAMLLSCASYSASARAGTKPWFRGGLIGRTESFLALSLACAAPTWFGPVAYVLGVLCFLTAGMRIAEGLTVLNKP